ncbi:NAD(P)/FAD-dependent oxidoreductase [Chitinophaga pendula]|uniref:ArsO family NAD(P)H-dependent flavin-containing monooxygenase n=1 Tax=Chitinophaga TaxID=79328 RepID=UPI000BB037A6|nr:MULTISPECIES: ArsO family NAD(P)H-dependent flavin-containing monooxygenase [Chitinophaga]ASZ11685.1 pyridine nucleotide-disulfide oxidoreductase [Chitinophaga sp. MD30]UCJ05302.1 NAD(P)/FAD-dependent oxidoreductase [Chitinophaga pendula]
MSRELYDVIIIGGGQSALAVAYYLRRSSLRYLLLDKEEQTGGAWQHTWHSLRLFSPAPWSSLPGTMMPGGPDYYPTRDETITYLQQYEQKYGFPIQRGVTVQSVQQEEEIFVLQTTQGPFYARTIVSATGSYTAPYIPDIPGKDGFNGIILHSADYRSPETWQGKRVIIVGEGNSGAQILADVSQIADTHWVTRQSPSFLPDHIDGRYLFDIATQQYHAQQQGQTFIPPQLGHIVMVSSVIAARERHVLNAFPTFDHFYANGIAWKDGRKVAADVVIFCTGFRPALDHLRALNCFNTANQIPTQGTRSSNTPGLWLVGYGNWTGFASATLIGVGRTARRTAEEITAFLQH